jgi:CRISPR-associated endonuclease/helicase Cas3
MKYLAHTANDKNEVHYLDVHLKAVGNLAEQFIRAANPELAETARWAGLLHDLGKYRDEFQEYLVGNINGSKETHHAVYGAALAFQKAQNFRCHGWLPVAFAIAAHHAGLHDRNQLPELFQKYETFLDRLPQIVKRFENELGTIQDKIESPPEIFSDKLKLEMATRMIFSCLVDADFLDTESHYQNGEFRQSRRLLPKEFLAKLENARQAKVKQAIAKGVDENLLKLRNCIFDDCLRKAESERGFFSLTVPTGGGKTLSAMAFALRHAEVHDLSRVIVVIPYLSIIEQNSEEYKKILDADGDGLIVENHSAVKIAAENAEEERSSEKRERSPLVLAAENWDAPVVVTTSVQFIESLFSNKTSRCRKLHNIANSVVIFDEVQTLPAHLLEPLFSVWRELKENYGVSFVFSTATQPAFRRQFNLKNGFADGEMTEIVENPQEVFANLQRVRYELPKPNETKTFDEVAAEMSALEQILCVVNTRRQAFELFGKLAALVGADNGLFHLSSAMCAEHRLQTITEIKKRLAENKSCRVVSTQLVEAGVDLDFPVLFRTLAPLDSIVQAAGRCNREGKLDFGEVRVFILAEHSLPSGIYKTATQITSSLLTQFTGDQLAAEPQIFGDYFSQLFDLSRTGVEIEAERKELNFREVAKAVKVIEDAGFPVIVPFGGDSGEPMKIVREIRGKNRRTEKLWFGKNDLRRLQRFMVNLRKNDFDFLQSKGVLRPLVEDKNLDLFVLEIGSYDDKFGVLTDQRPPNDCIL